MTRSSPRRRIAKWLFAGAALVLVVAAGALLHAVRSGSAPPTSRGGGDLREQPGAATSTRARGAPGLPGTAEDAASPASDPTAPRAAEVRAPERAWSPTAQAYPGPAPGEEAPVRSIDLRTYDPNTAPPPPNPMIPPKQHLSEEDIRAGVTP